MSTTKRSGRRRIVAGSLAVALAAAACSSGSDGDSLVEVPTTENRAADEAEPVEESEQVDEAPPGTEVVAPAEEPEPPVTDAEAPIGDVADWTLLVYVMGDNDLEPFAVGDMLEMAAAGSTDRVNVVALLDRHPEYTVEDDPLGDFADTQLIYVRPGDLSDAEQVGELNVGAADTLANFIATGISSYPAEHYGVVLWNHGAGWPGMGPDETDGNDILDLADINAGFEQGLAAAGIDKVDLVGFDACLMASYEVAATMADHADLMLASSELEPGHGWDYQVLEQLGSNPDMTPTELGDAIVSGFAAQAEAEGTNNDITLSLVDLAGMDRLEAALEALSQPLIADPTGTAPALARAQADALKFGANPDPSIDSHHVDLGQVASSLAAEPALAEPAAEVAAALGDMVLSSTVGAATSEATGLSIYFPPYADVFRQGYLFLEGVPAWPDVLQSFYTAGDAIPADEQAVFTNADGQGEYFFDEDGLNLFGTFAAASQANIVEADILYGVRDDSDDSIIFIGEEPAEVSDDGSGLVAAIYDLTALTISDGVDTDYAYLDLAVDADAGVVTIDVPLWYVAPEDFESDAEPQDVVLSLVLDLDFNILSEVYYVVNSDGTTGELTADPDGLIYPVVLNVYPDGTSEWLTLSERGLFANLPDLQYDFEPLEPGTELYAELVLRDFGGNTASVSMFDVIPG